MNWRETLLPGDREAVRAIVSSSGFFPPHEVEVALELIDDGLAKGAASPYRFLFPAGEDPPRGYACYGPNTLTQGSWDLYWIAVHADQRGRGLGAQLLDEVVRCARADGGRVLWIETSSRAIYDPTHAFYLAHGCREVARLPGFYARDDDKVVYAREL